jgi:hypothetical protein
VEAVASKRTVWPVTGLEGANVNDADGAASGNASVPAMDDPTAVARNPRSDGAPEDVPPARAAELGPANPMANRSAVDNHMYWAFATAVLVNVILHNE